MRDLEIRGVGNLLGENQSGHIAAVGYDLYMQMVTETVAELKGEEVREPAEIKLDIDTNAHLPRDYVAREDLRLEAYKRLADGHRSRRRRRHRHRVDRPLRPAAAAGRGAAHHWRGCAASARCAASAKSPWPERRPHQPRSSWPPANRFASSGCIRRRFSRQDLHQLVVPVPPKEDSAAFLTRLTATT